MGNNKNKVILYIVSWMCFGMLVILFNMDRIGIVLSTYNSNFIVTWIICLLIGVIYIISYSIVFGIAFSWILNMVYIISYKRRGYEFVSYCFYPFVYIKTNKKKFNLLFSIIYLYEIGSIIELQSELLNEKGIKEHINTTKKVFRNLLYAHYALIIVGILVGIFNFNLGGMIISFNCTIMMYQLASESNYFNDGYIYLSKNLSKDNLFNIMHPILKVSVKKKDYIYAYLQEGFIEKNLSNKIILELYQNIMLNSINDNVRYLDEKIEQIIKEELARDAHYNEYSFLNNYRLYRVYSIYVYKFYGVDGYSKIIKLMNMFYESSKSMPFVKDTRMFKSDKIMLENYEFNKLNLKEYFDICNLFDTYKKKIRLETIKSDK